MSFLFSYGGIYGGLEKAAQGNARFCAVLTGGTRRKGRVVVFQNTRIRERASAEGRSPAERLESMCPDIGSCG